MSMVGFSDGVELFIIGLAKKVIIANTMAVMVDNVWSQGTDCHQWQVAWVASIAYTLQIYFDFSGYSDMAIGLGKMFGFHFKENFNLPYISESITEFWRRWHISLSSWFRDYVYIPLGGNRKHVYLNLAIVFLLTGIWHGASWHFIIWGVWNGVFILVERYIKSRKKFADTDEKIGQKWIKKIYTLFVINFGWILFRAPRTREALEFVLCMFGINDSGRIGYTLFWYLDRWTLTVLIVGIVFSTSVPTRVGGVLKEKMNEKLFVVLKYAFLLMLFSFSVLRIVSGTYNPFIYFQF
jgi:D-alanyl-lipoteichoic acid acyltransferase DltB (MBOAT superfamily)